MKQLLILIIGYGLLSACSDTGSSSTNVFETQVESIEKAEAVEQQILDAAQRQREGIEENLNP